MKRLTAYLARLFVTDALVLFGVVCFLLWLVNCLRAFDVVSSQGQSIFTLAAQAFLTLPQLATSFFYVCVGIGLARALQALQGNRELHIIHTTHGLGSLWRATALVAGAGVVGVMLLSNFVEPDANRRLNILSAAVAADLVSSTLKPNRFTQVTPGVVLLIGGRGADGEIREFFADDRRDPDSRRTYLAESARVSTDGENYIIELRNGQLQYRDSDGRFSEIRFGLYDINVELLSQTPGRSSAIYERDSIWLITDALKTGWTPQTLRELSNRVAEGLRVIGICLIVVGVAGFPSGRRVRIMVPMEAFVLLLAFGERGISAYSPYGAATGGLMMVVAGVVILAVRLRSSFVRMVPA